VPLFHRGGDIQNSRAIVGRGVALAEKVGLDRGIAISHPLQVDFIEIIGLKDNATYDA
jgi:hypothetical protein